VSALGLTSALGLNNLTSALEMTNFSTKFETGDFLTIFAPNNAAMTTANWDTLDMPTLSDVLKYHVVPSVVFAAELTDGQVLTTLQGKTLTVSVNAAS
jgi:uncharacterized surface protein with fasciclin (FAS1) repeats